MKKLGALIFCLILLFSLAYVSAGTYTYLKAYYDSLDSSCASDSNCVVKNVESCCGYYPMCLNSAAALVPSEVVDICKDKNNSDCRPIAIAYCRCQKQSSGKKCIGFTGNPVTKCGDDNCYKEETNSSSDKYCPVDCGAGSSVTSNINESESCITEGDGITANNPRDINKRCCKGLSLIDPAIVYEPNNKNADKNGCVNNLGDSGICSNCGNGICESLENKCNCPKDCDGTNKPNCPQLAPINCPEKTNIESQGKDNNDCDKPGKCVYKLSNGRNSDVKIMPEAASKKAQERLGELGFIVILKEVGTGDNSKAIYEVTGEREGKFLGLFKTKYDVNAEVDAETGEVKVVKGKPFLVF